ncbi:hypothetical protein [Hydrogenophaga sp.]|uniref:hypothetical protein n=1 Tax=Hydrogenophaga sp. TaxID=1904254 RepID=UPI003D0BDC44
MPSAQPHANETADEEYTMPCVEALLAGTLALMTGYAQSACDCPHRAAMARKLVCNLYHLSEHPQLSSPMRTMVGNLRTRWQIEVENAADVAAAEEIRATTLWHATPASVQ